VFTGLIEEVGVVQALRLQKRAALLTVKSRVARAEMKLGASIAVNGTCLTVVSKNRGMFSVDVSPETLARTNLASLKPGYPVNLEPPLRFKDRVGGHLVTGHVDGVGKVAAIERKGDFTFFTFTVPVKLAQFIVTKGSVAVDGISLTVNHCEGRQFSVAIIPFTLTHTNLRARQVGDRVNIETDLIGKYVLAFLKKYPRV
jgi:riboflavin synthase